MLSILDIITPVNLFQEEERFFSSSRYHPQLRYDWNQELLQAYLRVYPDQKYMVQAMITQDLDLLQHSFDRFFETRIDAPTLATAQSVLSSVPSTPYIASVESAARTFERAVEFLGLDYQIEVVPQKGFFFRPQHYERKLSISKYAVLKFLTPDGAAKHELTHLIRHVNTTHNEIEYSLRYMPTEEGLASFMQDEYGEYGEASLFQHAAEYVASSVGRNGSLRDVVEFFQSIGFNQTLAWQRAIRHKFGFVDTSLPGDIMKPAMYFYHEQKIKRLPEDMRWRLFIGKIALDETQSFSRYKGQLSADHLHEFYTRIWTR